MGTCRDATLAGSGCGCSGAILVIEQDSHLRGAIRRLLESGGFHVLEASDAGGALDQLHSADLVLLAGSLPGGDGPELCRDIRRVADPFLEVIMFGPASEQAAECLAAGADDFVSMPLAVRELLARIQTRLRRRSLELALLTLTPPERMRGTVELLGAVFRRSTL